jgi:hypothetical protein
MDIINVFTLLLLAEKNCLQSEELYWIITIYNKFQYKFQIIYLFKK